jgi:hypothetical protein
MRCCDLTQHPIRIRQDTCLAAVVDVDEGVQAVVTPILALYNFW